MTQTANIDLEAVFYHKVIVICPNCKGTGQRPLYKEKPVINGNDICICCDGKGRMKLILEKLTK